MNYDNDMFDSSLLLEGAGIFRKKVRTIIEALLPSPVVNDQDWRAFVRQAGGPLIFAKKMVGDDNVSLLRNFLKHQREQVLHSDFHGVLGYLPAIVYGQVKNLIVVREQAAKGNELSDRFKAVFETSVARKCYGSDAESHLQPDWDRMEEYSDVGPTRGLYLGRFCVNPFYKKGPSKNLTQVESGSVRQWVIDIRFSADYENPNRFTPICKLGLGMMAYELKSVKDFINSFYQSPERLKWRKVGTGKKQRWSVWAPAYKDGKHTGWLWSPLTYRSSKKVDRMSGTNFKYTRKVYKKGDRWISARKSGEDTLKVTVWKTETKEVRVPPKLLIHFSQVRGENVFSQLCVEKRVVTLLLKEVTMTPQEWGDAIRNLTSKGWKLSKG